MGQKIYILKLYIMSFLIKVSQMKTKLYCKRRKRKKERSENEKTIKKNLREERRRQRK